MIPKYIHYCWFGGTELPQLAKKCIDSWKKYFPDYAIKEWNEQNFDIGICPYVKEAYEAKKWAFVSDYARFWILYNYGGIYFDTDVEVIDNMDDILDKGPFMGFQSDDKVNPGLGLAAEPGLNLYKEILEYYNHQHFIENPVSAKQITVVEHTTDILKEKGLKKMPDIQMIDGVYIYPKDYFDPMDHDSGRIELTGNTRSIHHYAASWCDDGSRIRGRVYRTITRVFGKQTADSIKRLWHKIRKL